MKDCDVCSEFKTYTKNTALAEKSSTTSAPYQPFPRPPDSAELGKHTWTFLHTMAAYYPSNPTDKEQQAMKSMFSNVSLFYPCGYCADHLKEYIKENPPNVDSNVSLSNWLCRMHNDVNARLGKPEFDCNLVFKRWRH